MLKQISPDFSSKFGIKTMEIKIIFVVFRFEFCSLIKEKDFSEEK